MDTIILIYSLMLWSLLAAAGYYIIIIKKIIILKNIRREKKKMKRKKWRKICVIRSKLKICINMVFI